MLSEKARQRRIRDGGDRLSSRNEGESLTSVAWPYDLGRDDRTRAEICALNHPACEARDHQ